MTEQSTPPTVRAVVSPRSFLRVARFMPETTDIRYYLNGIHIARAQRGGVYIVATDGACLAIDYDDGGSIEGADGVTVRVPKELLRYCREALKPKFKNKYRVLLDGRRLKVGFPGADDCTSELYIMPGQAQIEGKFPEFARVFPEFSKLKKGFKSQVDSCLLARFAATLADRTSHDVKVRTWFGGIQCWQAEGHNQIVVQPIAIPTMIGIVMPQHDDASENEMLGRMKAVAPPKPQAKKAA